MVKSLSTKGQMWYADFTIGLFIFLVALTIFFAQLHQLESKQTTEFETVLDEAESISSTLLTAGYPANWDKENVVSLGVSEGQRINQSKWAEFSTMNYSHIKNLFRSKDDFFIFLQDKNGSIINGGTCGIGSNETILESNLAYHYSQSEGTFMKDEMEALGADVFWGDEIDDLIQNMSNYSVVLLEDSDLDSHGLTSDAQKKQAIEDFVSAGNSLILSEDPDIDMLNVTFGSGGNGNITIVATDPYLVFNLNDTIDMQQKRTVIDNGAMDFTVIGRYENALAGIARWTFGLGKVYFFGDFNTDYLNRTIEPEVTFLVQSQQSCTNISVNAKNLVKIDRLVIYNSQPTTLVTYVWN